MFLDLFLIFRFFVYFMYFFLFCDLERFWDELGTARSQKELLVGFLTKGKDVKHYTQSSSSNP